MIERDITKELVECAAEYPVVTILGPRQSGKTTLVHRAGAILDEVQRLPSLLSYIQGIVDEGGEPGVFILTGSHQPRLHEAISQSLAGRTAILSLWPFSLSELRRYKPRWSAFELIVKGCFPRLHEKRLDPRRFYNGYLQTYVERDVRALINRFHKYFSGDER